MKRENIVQEKSMDFAVRVVGMYKFLICEKEH